LHHGTASRYQWRPSLNSVLDTDNAAPEWQAGSMGLRSTEFVVACPLEGVVGQL
jgi:hypothetical protein